MEAFTDTDCRATERKQLHSAPAASRTESGTASLSHLFARTGTGPLFYRRRKADISGLDSFARRINITAPFSGSTTREQHRMEVERIVTEVKSGNLIKAVAARQLVMESEFSLSNTFLRLCLEYPEAFIFCFGSEATGIWLGASPETLVAGQRGLLTSMALAGTKKCGSFRRLGRQELKGAQCGARLHPRRLPSRPDSMQKQVRHIRHKPVRWSICAHISPPGFGRQKTGSTWRQSQNSLFGYPLLRLSAVSRWSLRCGLSTYARTSTEAITAASAGHIRMKEILIFL